MNEEEAKFENEMMFKNEEIKGTVPPWKKLSNIPTRMVCQNVEDFLLNMFVTFPPKILRTLRNYVL